MIFQDIDFKGDEIVYDDFQINFDIPLQDQLDSLKEDLFQVAYKIKKAVYVTDRDWYPNHKLNGKFLIRLVKNYNWIKPILKKRCKTLECLTKYLKIAVDMITIPDSVQS